MGADTMWQALKADLRRQQEWFDGTTARWLEDYRDQGGRIYCHKGCRGCCNLAVNASFTEALLVAEAMSGEQAEALDRHMGLLRGNLTQAGDLTSFLRMHRSTFDHCPFLGRDGACGVYSVRPFSCRALLSTRNSDWCAVDFATLHPMERDAFMSGLDRQVVAFPTHYAAAPQDLAAQLETRASLALGERSLPCLTGNLPVLVHLESRHRLSEVLMRGAAAVENLLESEALNLPFLVQITSSHPE